MKRILFVLLALCAFAASAQADLVLREDTASQAVVLGPFVDSTDGNTAETALTISAADVRISVNGGNIVGKNSGDCTHDELGYYTCTFDATDTATVGRMQVMVHESGALPVYHEFSVVEEAVYDACCAASAAPLSATDVWAAGTRTLTALDEDTTTLDLNATTIGTVSTATAVTTVNGIAAGAITAAAIANGAIDAATFAADVDAEILSYIVDDATRIDASELNADIDSLTFTVTGQVDANAESMNAEAVCGTGDSGTAWTGCP